MGCRENNKIIPSYIAENSGQSSLCKSSNIQKQKRFCCVSHKDIVSCWHCRYLTADSESEENHRATELLNCEEQGVQQGDAASCGAFLQDCRTASSRELAAESLEKVQVLIAQRYIIQKRQDIFKWEVGSQPGKRKALTGVGEESRILHSIIPKLINS